MVASFDREPLLERHDRVSSIRKAVVLSMFNMKVALVKKRPQQVFLPLIFYLFMLTSTKGLFKDQWFPEVIDTPLWEPGSSCQFLPSPNHALAVACSTSHASCEDLANKTCYHLGISNYTVFQNHSDMMTGMREANGVYWTGVTFNEGNNITVTLPTIQQPMAFAPALPSPLTCRASDEFNFPCDVEQYMSGCFVTIQLAAQKALGDQLSSVVFRHFPFHRLFVSGLVASSVLWLVPVYLCFLLVNIFNLVLVDVVTEKEQRLRDLLKVNGVSDALYLVSWSVTNFCYGGLAIAAIAVTVKYGGLFPLTDPVVVAIPCALFFICLSSLAYILSFQLDTARSASIAGSVCDVILVGLGVLSLQSSELGRWLAWVPSVPFFQALNFIGLTESRGVASDLFNDDLMYPVIALLVNAIVLTAFAFYLGRRQTLVGHSTESSSLHVALEVSNLKKTYPPDVHALNGVSFSVARGETVVLLGNNGAGKTTLIRTLLGLVDPTEGWCNAGDSVAVCFQENTLWEKLSVRDHLQFFASLHGMPTYRSDLADDLELTQCLDQASETLSGGQKRRLAFQIALQNPVATLLVLDEPSSGVDVEGRRKFWKVLQNDTRAKLLTTHYLDEAEILGDRQIIMAKGKIVAAGKSEQLKRQFGQGYVVTVEPFTPFVTDIVRSILGKDALLVENTSSFRVPFHLAPLITTILQEVERRFPNASTSVKLSTLDVVVNQLSKDSDGGALVSADDLTRLIPRVGSIPGSTRKVGALAWIRIISQVHSLGSFANQFIAPLILVALSFALGKVNSAIGQPDWSGWSPIDFSDWRRVTNASSVPIDIPVALGAQLLRPLPSIFNAMIVNQSLGAFLLNSSLSHYYPFAIDHDNKVWVNQANPHIPPLVTSVMSSVNSTSVSSAPLLSVVAMTFTPQLISFILYFVLALVRISVVSGTLVAEERFQGMQRHLSIHGLTSREYWVGTLIGHFFLNLPMVLGTLVIAWWGFGHLLTLPGTPWLLGATAVVNCMQLILFSYLQSSLFTDRDTFLKWYPTFAIGSAEAITLACVSVITATAGKTLSIWLHAIASLLVPQYPLCGTIAFAALQHSLCTAEGMHASEFVCHSELGLFTTPAALPCFLGLAQALIMLILLLYYQDDSLVTTRSLRWLQNPSRAASLSAQAEETRIARGCEDQVIFLQLWHTYDSLKWAVRGLSVATAQGECLALLGTNGAGKTTAIAALTGSISPTAGYAGVKPGCLVGFCPQSDCHWPTVSAAQHARFYGILRGVKPDAAVSGLEVVELSDSANKVVKDFSGGMRRRLAVYLALLGRPKVLVLDEPTTGVDIEGKRRIWILLKAMAQYTTMLLTTHSMEEAEYLSTKICLMHEGTAIQVGSPANIRLDDGIVLSIQQVRTGSTTPLDIQHFLSDGLGIQVDLLGSDKYRVKRDNIRVSELFKFLLDAKSRGDIESFEVSPTTLEDSFLATVSAFKSNS